MMASRTMRRRNGAWLRLPPILSSIRCCGSLPTMTDLPTATRFSRAGFALPLVIIALLVFSMALAASLAATGAEASLTTAQRGQNLAYVIAEQGLQRFLISRDSLCRLAGSSCIADPASATSGQDSVQLTVRGGYAVIVARLLRPQQRHQRHHSRSLFRALARRGLDQRNAR